MCQMKVRAAEPSIPGECTPHSTLVAHKTHHLSGTRVVYRSEESAALHSNARHIVGMAARETMNLRDECLDDSRAKLSAVCPQVTQLCALENCFG